MDAWATPGTPSEMLGTHLRELMAREKAWSYGNMKHGAAHGGHTVKRHGDYRREVSGAKFVRVSQDIIRRLVRGHRLSEAYAEELISRHEHVIEELISARLPTDYIVRAIASSAA